ncbi:MAG: ATP-binding protein [Terriglobales bacterium]
MSAPFLHLTRGIGWKHGPQPVMEDTPPSSEHQPQTPQSCAFDPKSLDLKLSVTLAADRDAVDPVVRSVMDVVREMKCAPGREDDIELALTEALANAVVHGAKNDASKVIECDVACDSSHGILIIVRDPGPGFDPSKIPDPCHGENIYANHGRGIYLINQLMDEVQFHKNGTEIHMLKR